MIYKKIIPSSLLGRSLIIVFAPILILVVLTTFIFYQTSWSIISKRLAQSVVADINVIVKLIDQNLKTEAIQIAKKDFKMDVIYKKDTDLNPLSFRPQRGILTRRLQQSLEELERPFFYDLSNLEKGAAIAIQLNNDLLIISVHKDRLYNESAFVFLLWMFFASLILLLLSYLFMKAQIRPLKRLAIIAETLGRGLDAPELKVSGSLEIRQTTNAFNQMRTRIKRFLKQRTDMLAGVSHDLRTPLTRMKLQLSLMKDDDAKKELEYDIKEMTAMLNSYVSFVRGETPETIENIQLNNLIKNICQNLDREKYEITETYSRKIDTSGRPLQIKRAIQNILDNARRYASKIQIDVSANNDECFISISDNGPGIPEKNYEDVFKPFFTLDPSRNKMKGESGLGMTISRDIIRSHGGDIKLSPSSIGGLKTVINLPI
ncbi:MAG: Osmolarity sensor protein EnvZ [Alphaproteobacteria bacterium MarineAlpha5_Bin2]|jgi:two-component system osmolarity sensor histidine kinase EnvZ|nr:ATP-binding protein [Alphaproteobacteria bacterium]PPR55034.1 MAG: Osmolarity sensor protein EnvZ [Alphaproteobacteria bacterium MarineAlpha5_Bin2]PPR57223.1 MAG: Osmolarity sensor protein EnvZ [Alphaproteobacteria bacterium MarineAlpha5_Bin3]